MPEFNDIDLKSTTKSSTDSLKKSGGEESVVDAIDDFKSSLEPLKKQLADLVDQYKRGQSLYAECEEKVKKLSEKVSKVASPFEIFCNKTGVFFTVVLVGCVVGTFYYLWDNHVSHGKHEKLERKIENMRSELNQNLKDLRRDVLEYYNKGILAKIK
jgi:exonuclease VII small subunit